MIESVEFKNFKLLRDAHLTLPPLTLIVGPNSSGKSSILEGLHYLAQLGQTPPETLFRGNRTPEVLRSSGVDVGFALSMRGNWKGQLGSIKLTASPPTENGRDAKWSYDLTGSWGEGNEEIQLERRPQLEPPPFPKKRTAHRDGGVRSSRWVYGKGEQGDQLRKAIGSAVFLHLEPSKLARSSFPSGEAPRVEADGSNLAAALAAQRIESPRAYLEMEERLRSIIPTLKGINLDPTTITESDYETTEIKDEDGVFLSRPVKRTGVGYRLLLDFTTGLAVSASHASEGTLLTLGLMTVLCAKTRPRLVLIDELERGLHPRALGELVRQLRELQQQFDDLQIIATTHSPYLVDYFAPEEVMITTVGEADSALVAKLTEHPDFERWKNEMRPGEFWSNVAEDWIPKLRNGERA